MLKSKKANKLKKETFLFLSDLQQQYSLRGAEACVILLRTLQPVQIRACPPARQPSGLLDSSSTKPLIWSVSTSTPPHAPTVASEATKLEPVCPALLLVSSPLTGYLLAPGLAGAEVQAHYQLGCDMAFVLLKKEICWWLLKTLRGTTGHGRLQVPLSLRAD